MDFKQFLLNFNLHYLLTEQENRAKRRKTFRLPILVAFIKEHRSEYDPEAQAVMQTMLDAQRKACWSFDQWYHWLVGNAPFNGCNPFSHSIREKLEDTARMMQFYAAQEAA